MISWKRGWKANFEITVEQLVTEGKLVFWHVQLFFSWSTTQMKNQCFFHILLIKIIN